MYSDRIPFLSESYFINQIHSFWKKVFEISFLYIFYVF